MSMMSPDPETEFREEAEFRAKVYRMLSLGLSTIEIENLLRCKIDWNLFSRDTLEEMISQEKTKFYISLPPEYFSGITDIKNLLAESNEYFYQSNHAIIDFVKNSEERSKKRFKEFKESVTDIIAGFCVTFGIIIIAILGIILASIK